MGKNKETSWYFLMYCQFLYIKEHCKKGEVNFKISNQDALQF